MSKTRVVNVHSEKYDIYIGRGSIWENPFRIGFDGDRFEVIEKYRKYLSSKDKKFIKKLHELKGKKLGCHCAPLPCHGDVLKELIDKLED